MTFLPLLALLPSLVFLLDCGRFISHVCNRRGMQTVDACFSRHLVYSNLEFARVLMYRPVSPWLFMCLGFDFRTFSLVLLIYLEEESVSVVYQDQHKEMPFTSIHVTRVHKGIISRIHFKVKLQNHDFIQNSLGTYGYISFRMKQNAQHVYMFHF